MRVPAESGVPVTGARRRFTPEHRRAVGLVLDTGSTDRICRPGMRAARIGVALLGVPLTWGDARMALLSGRLGIGFVFADRLSTRG